MTRRSTRSTRRFARGLGIVLLCPVWLFGQDFRVVPDSIRQAAAVLADGSPVTRVEFMVVSDQSNRALELFHEVKSGLVWWNSLPAPGSVWPWLVLKTRDGRSLVGFQLLATSVFVWPSTLTATSPPMAQSVVVEALNQASRSEKDGSAKELPSVRLESSLGRSFFYSPQASSPLSDAKLRSARSIAEGWQLELDGVNSQTATVILSPDYRVVRAILREK